MSQSVMEQYRSCQYEIECLCFIDNDAALLREYDAAWNQDQENNGDAVLVLHERLVAEGRFKDFPEWWMQCDTEACGEWHSLVMQGAPQEMIDWKWSRLGTKIEEEWRESRILAYTTGQEGPLPAFVVEVTGLMTAEEVAAQYGEGIRFEKGRLAPLPKSSPGG